MGAGERLRLLGFRWKARRGFSVEETFYEIDVIKHDWIVSIFRRLSPGGFNTELEDEYKRKEESWRILKKFLAGVTRRMEFSLSS